MTGRTWFQEMMRAAGLLLFGAALAGPARAATLTVEPATAGWGDTVTWTVQDSSLRQVAIAFSQVPRGLTFNGQPLRLGPDAQVAFRGVTDAAGVFRVSLRIPEGIREDVFYFQAGTAGDPALLANLALSDGARLRIALAPEQSALAQVNYHRGKAGLPLVTLDTALSAGAAAHARYLVLNRGRPEVEGLAGHTEVPTLPGFTPEGERAGRESNLSRGSHGPPKAVNRLMAIPYHRLPMLDPRLDRIGFGTASDTSGSTPFNAHVLHVSSLGGRLTPDPIRYPAPGQTDVDLEFGSENPDPLPAGAPRSAGYTVTLQFPDSRTSVRNVTASLADAAGAPVAVHLSTPETPARPDFPGYQRNAIFMIPVAPLSPGTTYAVAVDATVNGSPFTTRWGFTTLARESPQAAPTLPNDAFARDGITFEAPVPAEFFNQQVVTLSGSVTGAASVAAGFRPAGSAGTFLLRGAGSPVVGGRFRLELLFEPEEVGAYEMLFFKSPDGGTLQGSFSRPVTIQVF